MGKVIGKVLGVSKPKKPKYDLAEVKPPATMPDMKEEKSKAQIAQAHMQGGRDSTILSDYERLG